MTDDDALEVALAGALGLSESTVSHHLTQLRKAGWWSQIGAERREALVAIDTVLDPNCCR